MRKTTKQILSLLLALILMLNLVPVAAMAEETESGDESALEISRPADLVVPQEAPEHIPENYPYEESAGEIQTQATSGTTRYTVLLVDTESSFTMTSGGTLIYSVETPIEIIRAAAKKFISQLQSAGGTNYVAVVSYDDYASIKCGFSTDSSVLNSAINNLYEGDFGANINDALQTADELLSAVNVPGAIKNVVLFSQGVNGSGSYTDNGPYDENDCTWVRSDSGVYIYQFSNASYNTAQAMMEKYNLYSIGLFQSFDSVPEEGRSLLIFAKRFAEDLQNKGFYDVEDVDDLEFIFGEVAEALTAQRYPFKFTGHLESKKDVEGFCYYSDGYFLQDADKYNEHLATMSLCFELTTWSRYFPDSKGNDRKDVGWGMTINENTNHRAQNAYNLLVGELKFDCFELNEFWAARPTKDSIGAVAAYKYLPDGSVLIALGIRGGGYQQEWSSNFTLGKEGEHAGFAEAKDNVLAFLKKYIEDHEIEGPVKIWLVGYSRGGGVANMVAGELNNGYDLGKATVDHHNLYCYTFEAPQGALTSSTRYGTHTNIKNIINLNDVVPMVAPSMWGFDRYNTDRKLPSKSTTDNFTDALEKMQKLYNKFEGKEDYAIREYNIKYDVKINWLNFLPGGVPFIKIEEQEGDIPTETLLMEGITFLFDAVAGDRVTYYRDLQTLVRQAFSIANGGDLQDLLGSKAGGMTGEEFLNKFLAEFTPERIVDIVKPMVAFNLDSFEERKDKVKDNLTDLVKDILNDSDLWGTVLFIADLPDILTDLLWRVLETTLEDLFNKDTSSLKAVINLIPLLGGIGQAHYPEITLAWVMSQDSYYNPGQNNFSVFSSRVVRINCPVDVYVYRSATGELVAGFEDDQVLEIPGSTIQAYMDNGEKVVMLPGDAEYYIYISATGDGTLNYTISEYNWDEMNNSRILSYRDIPISVGDILTAVVPEMAEEELSVPMPDGSSVDYDLYGDDGREIPVDDELTGEDASAVYTVNVTSNIPNGSISGSGTYSYGSFAQVEASPVLGIEFLGWYQDDVLISEETVYRFVVTEDVELEARFTEREYKLYLDAELVGEADMVTIDGYEYPLTREGDRCYVVIKTPYATNMVTYYYNDPAAEDLHTQYPIGMKIWMLKFENNDYTITYVPEFENLLQYSGCSIRIRGVKGIRMITSLEKADKQALTGKGLAGYTLVEYGTALAWASDLEGGKPLTLGQRYTKSNYAYKRGVADPVFKNTADLVQYTNVLVGFEDDQCIPDIAMRPYIIVQDAQGNQSIIYGGVIYRSIGYIAYQNRDAFTPGSNSYEYVWGIIHHVYGDQYDAEYKG